MLVFPLMWILIPKRSTRAELVELLCETGYYVFMALGARIKRPQPLHVLLIAFARVIYNREPNHLMGTILFPFGVWPSALEWKIYIWDEVMYYVKDKEILDH